MLIDSRTTVSPPEATQSGVAEKNKLCNSSDAFRGVAECMRLKKVALGALQSERASKKSQLKKTSL